MPPETAKTSTDTGTKKVTRRRKKKVRTATAAESDDKSRETAPGGASPKQVDVGSVARAGADRAGETASPAGADKNAPAGRRKTSRRRKKTAGTPAVPETAVETASTKEDGVEPQKKARRKRRGKKTVAPPAEQRKETASSARAEKEPFTSEVDGRSAPPRTDLQKGATAGAATPADSGTGKESRHDRPRRRRTRRGGRMTRPNDEFDLRDDDITSVVPASEPDDDSDHDDELIEESDDAVEVGDVTFPKPNLKERCKREMIINVTGGEECRIAILQDKRLEELFIERASSQSHVGNIYKGRVTNVEPSIQAAFVDFGLPKNGFLHISDVQPQYFPEHMMEKEEVGRKIPRHHRPPIQKCFRRGQEVMVQITKEGVGTKGPTLTTYLSIPGRFLVMMPGMNRHGVSRKIEDEVERRKMKDVMSELTFPNGMGFILRTAGMGQTKRELQRDLNYLVRLWKRVVDRVKSMPSPAELYRESDLVTRTIRDVYSVDFDRLIVDDAMAAKKSRDFFQIAMPRSKPRIEAYTDPQPIFHALGIEEEIERINARHVPLRSGGSLVIDSTEALVAIDVNSGRFRVPDDAEETALRINVEAADEIARQLRLRDLGGLIVCDFIDMRFDRNKRTVERALRDALKKHKERARILRMSAFGLIEMTRQRQGPSMKRNIYFDCPHCHGSGLVKMPESVILDVMRSIQLAAHHAEVRQIRVTVSTEVGYQILNTKRTAISTIESATGKRVLIRGDLNFTSDQVECLCEDDRGQPVAVSGVEGVAPVPLRPAPPR